MSAGHVLWFFHSFPKCLLINCWYKCLRKINCSTVYTSQSAEMWFFFSLEFIIDQIGKFCAEIAYTPKPHMFGFTDKERSDQNKLLIFGDDFPLIGWIASGGDGGCCGPHMFGKLPDIIRLFRSFSLLPSYLWPNPLKRNAYERKNGRRIDLTSAHCSPYNLILGSNCAIAFRMVDVSWIVIFFRCCCIEFDWNEVNYGKMTYPNTEKPYSL